MAISTHIVIISVPGWGHIRALVAFACRIVQQQPDVGITILAAGDVLSKTVNEISRYLTEAENHLRENIRVISTVEEGYDVFQLFTMTAGAGAQFYQWLYDEKPVTCISSGITYSPWLKPKVVIVDVFLKLYKDIRAIDPSVTLLGWSSASNPAMLRMTGPTELGSIGDIRALALAESERTGKPVNEVAPYFVIPENGEVVEIPGLPPVYDYEFSPQQRIPALEGIHVDFAETGFKFIREADGIITSGSSAFEEEAINAFSAWLGKKGKRFYTVGPLLPTKSTAHENEKVMSTNGNEVERFLQKTLEKYGEHSLLYVSFGSAWWPASEQIWKFMDVVIDMGIPFIFAVASPMAVVPEEMKVKVEKSGLGLFSKWAPQQLILNHKATGWFVTHCGQNSVIESLAEGVPMIAWPLAADQPFNAIRLSQKLDAAYQLVEARTGEAGLRRLKQGVKPEGTIEAVEKEARTVLEAARGSDGKRKRQNAEAIMVKMVSAWKEGGEAITQLKEFLEREL